MQNNEIDRVPSAAVYRRVGAAHLPDTGREHTFTERSLSEQVFRRLEGDDERIVRLGANAIGRGESEIDTVTWPRLADHFPTIVNFAITKHDQGLVTVLVENAQGELTGEKRRSIQEHPVETRTLDRQLEVQHPVGPCAEGSEHGEHPEDAESQGGPHDTSEKNFS